MWEPAEGGFFVKVWQLDPLTKCQYMFVSCGGCRCRIGGWVPWIVSMVGVSPVGGVAAFSRGPLPVVALT